MNIHRDLAQLSPIAKAVVTIGTFDGIHFGHKSIIERVKQIAKNIGGKAVVLTFFPHPRMVLHPEDTTIKLLNTINERIAILEEMGIDDLIIMPFTLEFSQMSAIDFTTEILVKAINIHTLVIGYDHHFGNNREAGLPEIKNFAKQYNFSVEEIPEQDINEVAVSSTKIRKALNIGDISTANAYLTQPYTLTGTVVEGDKIGRTLGYPTANVHIAESYKLIPADGIYAAEVLVMNKIYKGMLYIGRRPVLNGLDTRIEVNIFDFNEDIYAKSISLKLMQYIRPDMNLSSLQVLTSQMAMDKIAVIDYFKGQ